MNSLVVYDSVFGNTKIIAEEIGKELGENVLVQSIGDLNIDSLEDFDYLFIGSPTRKFKPTNEITDFVKKIKKYEEKLNIACFDTRMHMTDGEPWILKKLEQHYGYAVDTMIKILKKSSKVTILEPNWFFVNGSEGPLEEREIERAKEWARNILIFNNIYIEKK